MNGPNCVEPIAVFQKQRREGYQALEGDADFMAPAPKFVYPSYLRNNGRVGEASSYQDLVDTRMNREFASKILNSDYDDHGLTEDYDWVQTHSNHW